MREDPTQIQLRSACFSFDHSFGLKTAEEQFKMMYTAREWWIAIIKEIDIPSRHPMVLNNMAPRELK